jgi:ribosomal protein S18 acetylase RimI-like enzyme
VYAAAVAGVRRAKSTPIKCRIRRGEVSDVAGLQPLWISMVDHHRAVAGEEWPVRGSMDAWAIRRQEYLSWLADGTGTLLVATLGRSAEMVGYAMLCVHPPGATWDLGAEIGEVESLAVAEAARGAGVGSGLLDACRSELVSRKIAYWSVAVVEANAAAVRLYEREGFRPYYRLMLGRLER